MRDFRQQSDEELLADSRVETFRGPGPGGQKRNKTSSAVRITHVATGVSVTAGKSRSQHRNRSVAISRLRHKLAVQVRQELDSPRLSERPLVEISQKSAQYPAVIGATLDALDHTHWSVSQTAKLLGVSTGRLVGFLSADPLAWAEVNRQRRLKGLRVLNS